MIRRDTVSFRIMAGVWVIAALIYFFGSFLSLASYIEIALVMIMYLSSATAQIVCSRIPDQRTGLNFANWLSLLSLGLVGYVIILPLMRSGNFLTFLAGALILILSTFPIARFSRKAVPDDESPRNV
jgi:cobalamin synthase